MTIRLREEIARVRESVKPVQGTGASEGVGPARTRTNPPLHPPAPDGSAEASGPSPTSHAEESQALTFPSLKLPEASTDRPSPAGGGQSGRAPDVAASAGRGPARWNESPFPPESLPTLAQGSEAPSAVRAPVATPASPASLAFVPVWGNAPLSLGPLDASVADPRIGDILVVGPDRVFAEVDGTLTRVPVAFGSDEAVLALAQRIAAPLGRELTVAHPFMDARMDALGLRVTATIPPFSRRPTLSIRKTRSVAATEEDLLVSGFASPEALRLLGEAVRARRNLVITGPTGAGKTTLARYLARHVPPQERIITVEETYELGLSELHPHVVELETRSGPYAIDADLALRQVLHMRPEGVSA